MKKTFGPKTVLAYTSPSNRHISHGLSLVELLVIIAVVGILLALLIPAIQATREMARRSTCSDNLRQLGAGALAHAEAQGHLPTGGWGYRWVGDADRGFGVNQPGGWLYTILPYIEQEPLFLLPRDGDKDKLFETQVENAAKLTQTPLPLYYCPSRRIPKAYSAFYSNQESPPNAWNAHRVKTHARNDYVGNGGEICYPSSFGPEPQNMALGDNADYWEKTQRKNQESTGVIYRRSTIKLDNLVDGISNTYLAGEKYLYFSNYNTGESSGDDRSAYQGADMDILRWSNHPPASDTQKINHDIGVRSFGSAHSGGWNAAFCDGSVRFIPYDLDMEIHRRNGHRQNDTNAL